jgi:hypothetical protein
MKLGARYYDPVTGRFITPDPSHDGLNWYQYAGNDPVSNVDPTGEAAKKPSPKKFLGGMFNSPDARGMELMLAWAQNKDVVDKDWAGYLWASDELYTWVCDRVATAENHLKVGESRDMQPLNTTIDLGVYGDSNLGYDLLGKVHLQATGTVTKRGTGFYEADLDIHVWDTLDLHPEIPTDFIRSMGALSYGIPPWRKTKFDVKWHARYVRTPSEPKYTMTLNGSDPTIWISLFSW